MIVEPNIFYHPKFIHLKSMVGEIALELLCRIWGHCQHNKRGENWNGVNADYIEVVCCGSPKKGKIFAALVNSGWIEEKEGKIVIHDWSKHNSSLQARWTRNLSGKAKSAQTPAQTPAQDAAQPSAEIPDKTRQDKTRQDKTRQDKSSPPPAQDSLRNFPDVPKAVEHFQKMGADYTEKEIHGAWLNLTSQAVDGQWVTRGKSPRPIADWRTALEAEMTTRRQIYTKSITAHYPAAPSVSASVAEISKNKKIAALEEEQRNLATDLRSLRDSHIEPPAATVARLKAICHELAQLKGTAQ